MAPGGGVFKEEVDSYSKSSNYDIAIIKTEKSSTSTKPKIGFNDRHGISSLNGAHELLQCPVCKTSMYPPIHQYQCVELATYQ